MKYEIIETKELKLIGISKKILFLKGFEECPKFWNEFYFNYMKPSNEDKESEGRMAVRDNCIGEYAICKNAGNDYFEYAIAGKYKGGVVPEKFSLYDIPNGRWIKFYFEGGLPAFQKQHEEVFKKWLPTHQEYEVEHNLDLEWYGSANITAPDYKCGIMLLLK